MKNTFQTALHLLTQSRFFIESLLYSLRKALTGLREAAR
ncbi:hypothetical protein M2480_001817 [Parabacteroides sp. PFB2-12]|nr:hypothetical protein [Parabacteroides sp. PM6-13]MDH6390835.1 hypothetical protein [Parabacteroides sp. PFB2-12]